MRATEVGLAPEEGEHLISEEEAAGHPNAILRDVTTLCGKEFESAGSYKVSAAYSHVDGLEEYLAQRADSLCAECLREAVREHGWPETADVTKRVFSQ